MSNISSLRREVSNCYQILSEVKNVQGNIYNVSDKIKNALLIKDYYQIDDCPADQNKISDIKEQINSSAAELNGTISALENRISELNQEIEREEEAERMRKLNESNIL